MKSAKFLPILLLMLVILSFFYPLYLQGKLPIPADTIVGLYHPFRDLYAKTYPRGIPFKNSLITDPVRQQYPWRYLAILMEKDHNFPLWNPYNMAGSPLLANMQSAPFYPLNILFLLSDFSQSWGLLILLQPLLAGIFMYLYLKNIKLNEYASFFGGFIYAFCGFSIAWLEWGTIGHVALWLPLVILCIDKLVLSAKNKKFILWSLLFVFSLCSSFFAGHLQSFFYLYIVVVSYFFARWLQNGRRIKVLFIFLIINALFIILTSIQWIPTLQLIGFSARDIDQQGSFQKEGWFLPVQHLVQFIAPDYFGNPATLNYWGIWNYGELIGYIGIAPLIMAFFALFYRYDKKTFFFGSLFFLSLIFALPTWFARISFELGIPFLNTAQPTRLLFFTDFSLSVLAGLGFDYFIRSQKKNKIIYPLLFTLFIYLLLWIFVYIASYIGNPVSPENLYVARNNLYVPTVIFAVTVGAIILYIFIKAKKIQSLLIVALIVITIVDLFRFSAKFTPFTDKKYLYPITSSAFLLLKYSDLYRIMTADARIMPPNFSIMYCTQSIDGYDPLYLRRYSELIAAMERNAPDIRPPFGFNRIINPHNYNSKIADLLGVKYVLSLDTISSPKLGKVFEEGQTKIYQNLHVFDRAFFVNSVISSSSKQKTINAMFDKNIELRKTAVVEDWDYRKKAFINKDNKAQIVSYRSNKIIIKTVNKDEGFLVLTDTFYPTWHAQICSLNQTNCVKTKIYLTDYNFRGVIVPNGEHSVIFYNTLF